MDYSTILNINFNNFYDYTIASQLLLKWLNKKKLTKKDECIEIIKDFSNKYQPGEEYGGGKPCYNTDCYRDYTEDYFLKINNLNICPSCRDMEDG